MLEIYVLCTFNVMFQVLVTFQIYFVFKNTLGGLGQLFCFPRKSGEFPIHFCLVYYEVYKTLVGLRTHNPLPTPETSFSCFALLK
jgi:hypothetical protein